MVNTYAFIKKGLGLIMCCLGILYYLLVLIFACVRFALQFLGEVSGVSAITSGNKNTKLIHFPL
jgi:hypothetical protein